MDQRAPPLIVEHAQILLHNPPEFVPDSILRVLENATAGYPSFFGMTPEDMSMVLNDAQWLYGMMNSRLDSLTRIMTWRAQELTAGSQVWALYTLLDPTRGTVAWHFDDAPTSVGPRTQAVGRLPGPYVEDIRTYTNRIQSRQEAMAAQLQASREAPEIRREVLDSNTIRGSAGNSVNVEVATPGQGSEGVSRGPPVAP